MRWREGGSFENPPAGAHLARCIGLIDIGTQPHSFNNQSWTSRDVRIIWELPEVLMDGTYISDLKGKPFKVQTVMKQSLHPSAKLRKMVESWKGKKMTKDEVEKFDPKVMLGKACRLTLIENGDFVNVDGVSPLSKNDKCPKAINPLVFLSLESTEFDPKIYGALSEKLRQKIALSPEFHELMGVGDDVPPDVDEAGETDENAPF